MICFFTGAGALTAFTTTGLGGATGAVDVTTIGDVFPAVDVEIIGALFTKMGSVDGIGLPSLVWSFTTYTGLREINNTNHCELGYHINT